MDGTPLSEVLAFTSCTKRRAIYFEDWLLERNPAGVSPETLVRWFLEFHEAVANMPAADLEMWRKIGYMHAAAPADAQGTELGQSGAAHKRGAGGESFRRLIRGNPKPRD